MEEVKLGGCTSRGMDLKNTAFGYTVSLISGKYKMIILYSIAQHNNNMRFNELHRYIDNVSFTALSGALKELEASSLVKRHEYPQVPPRVEYSLTSDGLSLIPLLEQLCAWGKAHKPADEE